MLVQVIKSLAEPSNLADLADGVAPIPLEKILAKAQADSKDRLAKELADGLMPPSNHRAKIKCMVNSDGKKAVKTERAVSRGCQTTSLPSPPSPQFKYGCDERRGESTKAFSIAVLSIAIEWLWPLLFSDRLSLSVVRLVGQIQTNISQCNIICISLRHNATTFAPSFWLSTFHRRSHGLSAICFLFLPGT
jgi:hypothetical protein